MSMLMNTKQNRERMGCHGILKTDYYQATNLYDIFSKTQNKCRYLSQTIIIHLCAFLDITVGGGEFIIRKDMIRHQSD